MKPRIATIAVVLSLLGAAIALGDMPLIDAVGDSQAPPAPKPAHPSRVKVEGHVLGLYPGASRRLRATVSNLSSRAIVLRSVEVGVGPGGHGCAGRNLAVRSWSGGHRTIRRKRSAHVQLRVTMRRSAPDPCQGARFPLDFKARIAGVGSRAR